MNSVLKIKINSYNNLMYFILIPFLYPRGFHEYFGWYKAFFTFWLYLAAVLIVGMFLFKVLRRKTKYKNCIWLMLIYYITFITITLFIQGSITEGFQKLFMAPILCMLCAMCLQKQSENFIRCVSNILILNFLLNITLFSPFLWKNYFNVDNHIIFIGHVQVAAQLGILGIFISYLLNMLGEKKKSKWLLALSIITMLISGTSASYVTIALLLLFFLVRRHMSMISKFFFRPGKVILIYLALNMLIFALLKKYEDGYINSMLTMYTSGRMYIWREAIKLMNGHWIFGYGVYGILIRVFWSEWTNPAGMNYAHNELMQRLMDGGIVLALIFILMLYSYMKNIRKCNNCRLVFWAYITIIITLIIMLFESVTEYYYFFVLLSLMAYLPEIELIIERRKNEYGNYIKD